MVDGLKELARDLRSVDKRLGRELTRTNREFGKKVLDDARRQMGGLPPGGSVAASGAASLKLKTSPTMASLIEPASNPFVRALEFGTTTHVVFGRRVTAESMRRRVFEPHNREGYAVGPTVDEWVRSGRADKEYGQALERTLKGLGWR